MVFLVLFFPVLLLCPHFPVLSLVSVFVRVTERTVTRRRLCRRRVRDAGGGGGAGSGVRVGALHVHRQRRHARGEGEDRRPPRVHSVDHFVSCLSGGEGWDPLLPHRGVRMSDSFWEAYLDSDVGSSVAAWKCVEKW